MNIVATMPMLVVSFYVFAVCVRIASEHDIFVLAGLDRVRSAVDHTTTNSIRLLNNNSVLQVLCSVP